MNTVTFECIERTQILQKCISLLTKFTGLEFQILDISSPPLKFNCPKKNNGCTYKSENCDGIDEELLNQIISSRKPQLHLCRAGSKKIVTPLFSKEDVLGVLLAVENGSSCFAGVQISALANLLIHITNYIIKNEFNPLNGFNVTDLTPQQAVLGKVTRYIRENFHKQDLTLKEVAHNNNISYHYLSHLFNKELKTTFVEYRNLVRMEAAAKLLRNNRNMIVSEVGYSCGFNDPAYFCKVFKRSLGHRPGDFRRKKSVNAVRTKIFSRRGRSQQKIAIKKQRAAFTYHP